MLLKNSQIEFWNKNGYLALNNFFNYEDIELVNEFIEDLWNNRSSCGPKYVIDIFIGESSERRVYFADAPEEARTKPYKLNDLFLTCPEIRKLNGDKDLLEILSTLLYGQSMICNSLNFEYGSQQPFHFDTFYMPSPTPNKMLATWIALEDVTMDNGPLEYYPASHLIPPYFFSNGTTRAIVEEMPDFREYIEVEIRKRNLEPKSFRAKKGDVFIWHAQLFHGGSPINDPNQTRRSLVTHYFTEEDFPSHRPTKINEFGSYMDRGAQSVNYPFS